MLIVIYTHTYWHLFINHTILEASNWTPNDASRESDKCTS